MKGYSMKKLLLIALMGLFVSTTGLGVIKELSNNTYIDCSIANNYLHIIYTQRSDKVGLNPVKSNVSATIPCCSRYWQEVDEIIATVKSMSKEHGEEFKQFVEEESAKAGMSRNICRLYNFGKLIGITAIIGTLVYGAAYEYNQTELQNSMLTQFIKAGDTLLDNAKALFKSGIDKIYSWKKVTV